MNWGYINEVKSIISPCLDTGSDVTILTSDSQIAMRWWSRSVSRTPVGTFIGLLDSVDNGLLRFDSISNNMTVPVEIRCTGGAIFVTAMQSDVTSFRHRKSRDLQNKSPVWTERHITNIMTIQCQVQKSLMWFQQVLITLLSCVPLSLVKKKKKIYV